ncbi:P-loop containing nucleoside triphosphate hydrolase protein [Gigaspora margarita]|uniref:P-loop containing nucleoside triphosphate hydrolase protein n=1 Tax=Gigaspora margarita TaxID=4874 RepID=A0A8H3XCE1_GIGMA|nr:P-loop containing nucleoside triphosphate hydrolase protein [Gigaspora margarita]
MLELLELLELLEFLFLNSETILFLYNIISICVIEISYITQTQQRSFYEPLPDIKADTNSNNDNGHTFTSRRASILRLVVNAVILMIWTLHVIMYQDSIELQHNIWHIAWIYATALAFALFLIPQQCRALHINIHLKILYTLLLISVVAILYRYCLKFGTNLNAEYFMVLLVVGLLLFLVLILEPIINEGQNLILETDIYPNSWIFSWVIPLIITGYNRTLTYEDVPELPNTLKAENVINTYYRNRNISLLKSFFFSFWKDLFVQFICAIVWILLDFLVIPSIFEKFLCYIKKYLNNNNNEPQSKAFLYVYELSLFMILSVIFSQQAQYICRQIANKCQTIINIEVHRKVMDLKDIDGDEKGKITDLMSIDAQKVSSMVGNFLYLYTCPLQFITAMYYLHNLFDVSSNTCIISVIIFILILLCIILVTLRYKITHELFMKATDKRIELTNELLQSIRSVKLFAREEDFHKNITEARDSELNMLKDRMRMSINMGILWTILPFLIILPTIANDELTAPVAFAAITVCGNLYKAFNNLPYQIICFIQAFVSITRVKKFLKKSEIIQYPSANDNGNIGFINATLQWPNDSNNFVLKKLDVLFPLGKLSLIHGPTGCGKSALLKALLGEMKCCDGFVLFPNGEVDVAYVSQTAWFQNGTIRDNILFGSDFIATRYSEVLRICDLTFSDETEIGERGITLSDGQKQRIALARAIYSSHNIIILDNCLSAIDSYTEQYIYENCLRSDLMKNRTRIFVTHHKNFYGAALKIFMKDGMIIKKKEYFNTEELQPNSEKVEYVALPAIKYDCTLNTEEAKAEGRIKLNVYMTYLKFSKFFWPLIIILIARFVQTLQDWLISEWTKVNDNDNQIFLTDFFTNNFTLFIQNLSHKSENINNYLIIYTSLGFFEIFLMLLGSYFMIKCTLRPSKKLHNNLLDKIVFATIKFYDTTPIGRIMNRFSKDMELIDQILPLNIESLINSCSSAALAFTVISFQGFRFFATCIVITATYIIIGTLYISTSRELKRLEAVNRSSIYAAFDNIIEGRSIIRAFGVRKRFNKNLWDLIDRYNRPILMNWACNQWLHVYSNFIGGLFMLIIGALIIADLSEGMDPAFAGFIFINIIKFINHIIHIINTYTAVEMNMNSVERIKEYLKLEEEIFNTNKVLEEWPTEGNIEVKNLKVQYSNDGPPVLRDISFCVSAGEKIGIVGRTGSGKSTLVKSIFRTVNPTYGQIKIDDVDISTIGLSYLRKKFTIIPQNPTLFNGTLRNNIDFSEGGCNLSHGQRQLIMLARALINKSKVVILDEATANIDLETDNKIQKTIRKEFKDSTLLCIAHRLRTVINYDRILVLDSGYFGNPYELLQNRESMLGAMYIQSNEFEDLLAIAKSNHEERQLNINLQ